MVILKILIAAVMLPIIVIVGAACGVAYMIDVWIQEIWRHIIEN